MTRAARTALDDVADVAGRRDLVLRRAWPRDADHLLLDLVPSHGPAVAGQWFADPVRAAAVAASTGAPALADGHVVLQPRGADRRLTTLADLLRRPGAQLVAHRPERRAVVRRGDGSYTKVLRAGRAADVARAARAAAVPGLRVPRVLAVDSSAGTVTTSALPGRTLHELLAVGAPEAVVAARATGRALATLHAFRPVGDAPLHDGAAELQVLRRWEALAAVHGLAADLPAPADDAGLTGPAQALVPVHRDLHDKQVLLAGAGVGLLDFDLAALGEPALDLANLLVHLELRVLQGLARPGLARATADAALEGYGPGSATLARLPAYDRAARRRLVAVYAFRPRHAAAARLLLDGGR